MAAGLAFLIFSKGDSNRESPSELSVEEVYRRAGEALRDSGLIYFAEIEAEGDSLAPYRGSIKRWVDGSRQLGREESALEFRLPSGERLTFKNLALHTREATYRTEEGRVSQTRSRVCHEADLASSVALGCPGPTEQSTTTVATGSYEGRKAVVLITQGTSRGSDETFIFTERLYLDPKTYLPFAFVSEGEVDFGEKKPTSAQHSYKTTWLGPDKLPADFFEPAAIGYTPPDPEAGVRGARDLQVYWLGGEFSAPSVDALVLRSSFAAPGRGAPYRYSLTYARAANPFDPPFLTLQVFYRDMWESVGQDPPRSPAILAQAVFIGDTVVFFSEGGGPGGARTILTPEGLDELKRGLRPYDPAP